MKISARTWHKYIGMLSTVDKRAGEMMRKYLDSRALNYADPKDIEGIVRYAYALSTKYGEAVAELACRMYDLVADAQSAKVPTSEPAEPATYNEVEKAVRGSLKQSPSGQLVSSTVERLVKQASADTMLQNAKRDGAYFAWVPNGDTCPFCLSLAALGWQRAGRGTLKGNHAEHIHAHCDCTYAIDLKGNMQVEGYDPDAYVDKVRRLSGDRSLTHDDLIKMAGRGNNDYSALNAIRRKQYKTNKDIINVQKRDAYAVRKAGGHGEVAEATGKHNQRISDYMKSGDGLDFKNFNDVKDYLYGAQDAADLSERWSALEALYGKNSAQMTSGALKNVLKTSKKNLG